MLGTTRDAVTVMADPVVGPGGCIVTSGAKTVDARIEEALARARAALCSPADPLTSSYDGAAGMGLPGMGLPGTAPPGAVRRRHCEPGHLAQGKVDAAQSCGSPPGDRPDPLRGRHERDR